MIQKQPRRSVLSLENMKSIAKFSVGRIAREEWFSLELARTGQLHLPGRVVGMEGKRLLT